MEKNFEPAEQRHYSFSTETDDTSWYMYGFSGQSALPWGVYIQCPGCSIGNLAEMFVDGVTILLTNSGEFPLFFLLSHPGSHLEFLYVISRLQAISNSLPGLEWISSYLFPPLSISCLAWLMLLGSLLMNKNYWIFIHLKLLSLLNSFLSIQFNSPNKSKWRWQCSWSRWITEVAEQRASNEEFRVEKESVLQCEWLSEIEGSSNWIKIDG